MSNQNYYLTFTVSKETWEKSNKLQECGISISKRFKSNVEANISALHEELKTVLEKIRRQKMINQILSLGKSFSEMSTKEIKELVLKKEIPFTLKKKYQSIANWNEKVYNSLRKAFKKDFLETFPQIDVEVSTILDYRFRRRWQYIAPLLLKYENIYSVEAKPLLKDVLKIQPFLWEEDL